jgi:acetate kinase
MGLTPAGGLMMGTRAGDLDPGVVLYLQEARRMSTQAVRETLNRKSGLLGVSGISSDMQDLAAREAEDSRAAEAIALYCYQAKKFLGALVAVLGGLDTLVFTAGIGENAPPIRARICANLEFLGIKVDPEKNRSNQAVISTQDSRAAVRVIKTDEDRMIARHAREFLR